jgi:hypothetical protein
MRDKYQISEEILRLLNEYGQDSRAAFRVARWASNYISCLKREDEDLEDYALKMLKEAVALFDHVRFDTVPERTN